MITVLANALNIDIGNLCALDGERRVSLSLLRHAGMVTRVGGAIFVRIPGAGLLVPTLIPNNLFSIEECRLRYVVQENEGYAPDNEPQQEEEVEHAGGEPEEEVQPPNPYTTYDDVYMLEGSINNMSSHNNSLRDTTENTCRSTSPTGAKATIRHHNESSSGLAKA